MKGEAPYFTPQEVIAGLNLMMAIIDWPQDTINLQKNFMVSPEDAKKLILPLHPLWDEKVGEVAAQMSDWDKAKLTHMISECTKRCDCEFYLAILDRHPEIASRISFNLAGQNIQKTKSDHLNCLRNIPSLQKLIAFLEEEKKNFEAGSVL